MKSVTFQSLSECRMVARSELIRFSDDPRSVLYRREFVRPKLEWHRLLKHVAELNIAECVIFFVCVYQRFAPARIRNRCRFEPSCSAYMVEAIRRYGLSKGLRKGVDRIKRCSLGDGGFDYP